MEKTVQSKRVLARRLAQELSREELSRVAGRGTSYYGTGWKSPDGRYDDIRAGDCIDGSDVLY